MSKVDSRSRNVRWKLTVNSDGKTVSNDDARLAVLMDIRDELQALNALLHCQNFIAIPRKLDAIYRKLPTRRKRRPTTPEGK